MAEVRLRKGELKKYPFSLITNSIVAFVFVPVFMYLYKYLNLNNSIYSLAFFVVYMLGTLSPSNIYGNDITTGKFQQIFTGIITTFNSILVRTILSLILSIFIPIILILIANFFIAPINISILNLILVFLLFAIYSLTLGYILLGLKLKFRKIDAFQQLLISQILIISALPLGEFSSRFRNIILFFLPCGGVIGYAQSLTNKNIFSSTTLYLGMVINFIMYLALAILSYNKFYKSARKNGTLGWY